MPWGRPFDVPGLHNRGSRDHRAAMIATLASTAVLASFVFAVSAAALPLFQAWRSLAMACVMVAAAGVLATPSAPGNHDLGYGLGIVIAFVMLTVPGLTLALRLAIAGVWGTLTWDRLRGPGGKVMRWCDGAALFLCGAVAGTYLTQRLAWALQGTSLPHPEVIFSIVAAGLGAAAAWRLPFAPRAVCLGAALAATAILGVGAGQPDRILTQAEAAAMGRPWCLTGPDGPLTKPSALGFLGMEKSRPPTHLALIVQTADGPTVKGWSIRQQHFYADPYEVRSTCDPRRDFATAMMSGQIDAGRLAVGRHIYAVPPSLRPRASPWQLVIQTDVLVGAGAMMPDLAQAASIAYLPPPPANLRTEGALPLASLSQATLPDVTSLMKGQRLHLAAPDGSVDILCLRGAWEDRICAVRAWTGDAWLSFSLPYADITDWEGAVDTIDAQFARLRVTD